MLGGSIISSFPPIYFVIAAPVAIVALSLMFLREKSLKENLFTGLFAGFGFGIFGFYWFFYPIMYATNSEVLSVLAVVATALLGGLFFMGIACFSYFVPKGKIWLVIIYNTTIWSFFEWLRGEHLFGGIPWNVIATLWDADIYMLQMASFVGVYGLGFITYFLCSCFILLFTNNVSYKQKAICLAIVFVFVGSCHAVGYYRVNLYSKVKATNYKVAVLQPNVEQIDKIEGNNEERTISNLVSLTEALSSSRKDLLVVWPETAISHRIMVKGDSLLAELQKSLHNKSTLIAGVLRTSNNNLYNSALVLNPSLNFIDYYDKIHLVPFGEYIPGAQWLNLQNTFVSNFTFSEGKRKVAFKVGDLPLFKILICFEAIFADNSLNNKNIKFIVNIANDGWYGDSVEPYQHLSLVKFRAIEGGIPVVRAANSGISVLIDSVGNIKQYLSMFAGGYFVSNLPNVYPKATLFALLGNTLVLLINSIVLLGICFNITKRVFSGR